MLFQDGGNPFKWEGRGDVDELDRRSFLIKAGRWCAGMGALLMAGDLVSCADGESGSGRPSAEKGMGDENAASQGGGAGELVARVNDKCTGCGKCARGVCPEDAIRVQGDRAAIGASCRGCGRCVEICPRGALELVSPAAAVASARRA